MEGTLIYLGGFLIFGFIGALIIASCLYHVSALILKKGKTHIWFMTAFTLLLPLMYGIAEDQLQIMSTFEDIYSYEARYYFHQAFLAFLVLFGFTLGYLITPGKPFSEADIAEQAGPMVD